MKLKNLICWYGVEMPVRKEQNGRYQIVFPCTNAYVTDNRQHRLFVWSNLKMHCTCDV